MRRGHGFPLETNRGPGIPNEEGGSGPPLLVRVFAFFNANGHRGGPSLLVRAFSFRRERGEPSLVRPSLSTQAADEEGGLCSRLFLGTQMASLFVSYPFDADKGLPAAPRLVPAISISMR